MIHTHISGSTMINPTPPRKPGWTKLLSGMKPPSISLRKSPMPRLVHHDYSVEEVGELTPLTSKWDDPPRHFCLGDKLWIICANHDTMKTRQNSHFDAGLVFQRISWSIIIFFGGWQDFWRTDICKHFFFFRTKRRDCCGDPFGVWGEAPEAPSKKLETWLDVLGLGFARYIV